MEKLKFIGPRPMPHIGGVKLVKVEEDVFETDNPSALLSTGKFEKIGSSKKKSSKKKSGEGDNSGTEV